MKNINIFTRGLLMASALAFSLGLTHQVKAENTYTLHSNSDLGKLTDTNLGNYWWSMYKQTGLPANRNGGWAILTTNYAAHKGQFTGSWGGNTDVILGIGKATGSIDDVMNYSIQDLKVYNGDWAVGAYGWINKYGWDVEFYVQEDSNIDRKNFGPILRSYYSDGAWYDLYKIDPKKGFWQLRSVRRTKPQWYTAYKITIKNHYNQWNALFEAPYKLSTFRDSVFMIEDYDYNSHNAQGKVNIITWR